MANPEHVEILEQGIEVWNKWRKEKSNVVPDLSDEHFNYAVLRGADLSQAILSHTKLNYADFRGANLNAVKLEYAKLKRADLRGVKFSGAKLNHASLVGAKLEYVNFRHAELEGTDFSDSRVSYTQFDDVDLSVALGLESLQQFGPSEISISTIYKSHGKIPERFLRRCGVPDHFITFIPSLIGALEPIQFYSCFISYSNHNKDFAERLHADLQAKHVRCWFAPEDLKIGDRFQEEIEQSIRAYDKLLIILSQESILSRWVEREVNTAFEHEQKQNRTILFPIRLDDSVMDCTQPWAADIRRTRHIGDFTCWKAHDSYQKAFDRLLRDLKASGIR